MSDATIWGIIVAAWIAAVGSPYLVATISTMAGKGDRNITRLIWHWLPGFIAILLLSQTEIKPLVGIGFTVLYGLGAALVWRRRKPA